MATEAAEVEVEGKKKPILKIILLVVGIIVLLGGTVGGTLFFSGFFDKKAHASAEDELESAEKAAKDEGGHGGGGGGGGGGSHDGKPAKKAAGGADKPERSLKKSPELTRFEYTYKQLDKDLVSNITGSRKVMQVQLALMTSYDERVFKNVEKHEFALRSAVLDVMRQTTDTDLVRPEFRKELAEKIKEEINKVLEKYEDFGGIDAVHFTSFVVQ